MPAEGIKISTQEVRSTAGRIRTQNTVLNEQLVEIQNHMKGLQTAWQSQAGDAIRTKFEAVAAKYFDQYYQIVESYAKFLELAVADSYETTEAKITSNADAFRL